jgi:DNA-binding transcriptional regulator YdaS (Cro superfamily)
MTDVKDAIVAAGGYAHVAKKLGLTRTAVWHWAMVSKVPAERVHDVEQLLDLPRHKIRPDLYPLEREADPDVPVNLS